MWQRERSACLVSLGLFLVVGSTVRAAPTPSLAPKSWDLEVEFYDPARIEVVLPGEERPATFWYLIYTVTNNTGREVLFYPQFDLVTDTLQVVRGGDNVSPSVFDAIRKRYENLHPFLIEPLKVGGKLLQGADNARTSVAIFRDFDPQASKFTIYAGGLSGEIARVPNPAFDAAQGDSEANPQFFTLRKTLAIPYDLPGDPGYTAGIDAQPGHAGVGDEIVRIAECGVRNTSVRSAR